MIYLTFNSVFTVTQKAGAFEIGTTYMINGFGWGKPDKDGNRREFWEVQEKYKDEDSPIYIYKDEFTKLQDIGVIKEKLK